MRKNYIVVFVIASLLSIKCSGQSDLEAELGQIKSTHRLVGLSVGVVSQGEVIFSHTAGQRDLSRNLPVNDSTLYRIASISKLVAATALMQLYEQGAFDLDDDVSDYLDFSLRNPNYPDQVITFEKLLSHTSSLRDGSKYHNFLSATYNNDNIPHIKELVAPGGSYYSADMWSGTHAPQDNYFQYANINYGLIGTLIETLSGQRFDRYCQENILNLLNIQGSFNIRQVDNIDNVAVLYRQQGGSWIDQFDNHQGSYPQERDLSNYILGTNGAIFAPQGGLRASLLDMIKLMQVHANQGSWNGVTILNDTTISRMHQTVWEYNGQNGNNYHGIFNNYALGNHKTRKLLPGQTMIGHPGEAYGYIGDLYFSPDQNFGIIFMTNGGEWESGNYSGWYDVEEAVFTACYNFLETNTSLFSEEDVISGQFHLQQNYPNPFNPVTTVAFQLSRSAAVKLGIYNIQGQLVATLVDHVLTSGKHKVTWDSRQAPKLTTGLYFYRLESGAFSQTCKMVLLK